MKVIISLVLCAMFVYTSLPADDSKGYIPKAGFVPDEKTAIAIAEAVLVPIYGQKKIDSEKPFRGKLEGDIWIVEGSLPKGSDGGVAVIRLSKKDGHIIYVMHGK